MIKDILITLVLMSLVTGCINRAPRYDLSPGYYTLITDSTGIPSNVTEHSESQCSVSRNGSHLVVNFSQSDSANLTGTLRDNHITLTVRHNVRTAPNVEVIQVLNVFEGRAVANDHASGILKGYAGTNMYVKGSWILKKNQSQGIQQKYAMDEK